MPHFPMFVDLKDQRILMVGGGHVALRKLQKLAPYGGRVTVVAPEILPGIEAMPGLTLRRRGFRPGDLRPRPAMVIAATDNGALNQRISDLCRKRHIPVNVADDPALCSFLFPALVQQGEFSAGISTGGASPTAAAWFRQQLQDLLPPRLDEILRWLEARRPILKERIPDQRERARIHRLLFDACIAGGAPLSEAQEQACFLEKETGTVALVGAGCGKADLITVRGRNLLRQCQAVVYDDLIDPVLLDYVPESARRIYMGKRSGAHAASQDAINRALIALAREGLRVVRLKGGDPYLFGRGGEEMLALRAAGIPCQEVPGIPSAIGIPAEAGIPVTHRGLSRGLHIVTAHTADTEDGLPADFDHLAKLSGTLVFLMGLSRLPRIAARLMAAGKPGDTPAAVLSGGNSPNPARVRAPLRDLARAADTAGVRAPAIILVGDAAAMDLEHPLSGVRVGITGTDQVAMKQQTALEALGAETVRLVRSRVEAREIPELPDSGWLVFTSTNGVRSFFSRHGTISGHKLAVIGPATGEALEAFGLRSDLCPEEFTSEALAHALVSAGTPEEPVTLLRSAQGNPVLPEILTAAGRQVRDIAIYDTVTEEATQPLPALDYLTFSSAGGIKSFVALYGSIPAGMRCVCIGPVTAKALDGYTTAPYLTAEEISAAGIVRAIAADHQARFAKIHSQREDAVIE